MRIPFLSAACAALLFALPAAAQKIQVFGGSGESRNASTLFLFGENSGGGVFVQHGQPKWKASYDKSVAEPATMAGMQRLGKNWWSTFQTTMDLQWGDKVVPAGSYVLGLEVGKDGSLHLALMNSDKAMKSMSVFDPSSYAAAMTVPLTLHKDVAKEDVELMQIKLEADKQDPTKVTFTIAWGKHALVGNLVALMGKPAAK